MKSASMRQLVCVALALLALAVFGRPGWAGGRSKAVQETVDYVLQRFGRTAAREGAEALARKAEIYTARHGEDFLKALRQLGPRAFPLVEGVGAHGKQAVGVLVRYGEHGATWVVGRPKGMQLLLRHGDGAAAVLVKHKAVAEPLLEQLGPSAVRALEATSVQSGRRLGMMLEGGELTRIGRSPELLDVIGRYGDRAMTFVWEHKGALATTAGLTAFLVNPEPFLTGAKDLAQIVGENAVKPVMQIPGTVAAEVARGTNWTVVLLMAGAVLLLLSGGGPYVLSGQRACE
jgi:hypothetical protein